MNEGDFKEMVKLLLRIKRTNGILLNRFQSIVQDKPYAIYILGYIKVEKRGEEEYVTLSEEGEELLEKLALLAKQKL